MPAITVVLTGKKFGYGMRARTQVSIGSCESVEDNAGRLLCRVLAHYPSRNTILTDGGGIPLSKDKSGLSNWGTVYHHPELYVLK